MLNYYHSLQDEQSEYTHNDKPEIATDVDNTKQDALRKHVVLAKVGNLHKCSVTLTPFDVMVR